MSLIGGISRRRVSHRHVSHKGHLKGAFFIGVLSTEAILQACLS
jgi:hypothetical protein